VSQGPVRLGIDFGTSNTVAVLRWADGRSRNLLFDNSPVLPSAVYLEKSGVLLTGQDARYSARISPARFEPNPKRRLDEGTVLLGDQEVPAVDLTAAVLGRVADEAGRAAGFQPAEAVLTYPAGWGRPRPC
jgi:molecular chaperone DnaK (HSP70)